MYVELMTERLKLVPINIEFLETAHLYAGDLENSRFMMFLPNDTIEETKEFILRSQEEWKKENPDDMEFAIIMDGNHVGGVNLELKENRSVAEIGWTVQKNYWRRGIATEAALALIQYAKEKLKVKKIIAHCDTENVPSYKTMEKIGMHRVSESGGRKNKSSDEERREYLYEM